MVGGTRLYVYIVKPRKVFKLLGKGNELELLVL